MHVTKAKDITQTGRATSGHISIVSESLGFLP